MKLNEFDATETKSYKYVDVDEQVYIKMKEMIIKAINDIRVIDWDKFYIYCLEYFQLPKVTIERNYKKIKEEFNNGIQTI